MTIDELIEMDDAEFADQVADHLGFHDKGWALFEDPSLVERTGEALELLQADLDVQLDKYGEGSDEDWSGRTRRLKRMVDVRLAQTRRKIHHGNARQWRAVLEDLALEVEDSDVSYLLDEVEIPFADLTIRQWLRRREQKRGLGMAA